MYTTHRTRCFAFALIIALASTAPLGANENTRARDVVYGRKAGMALVMDVWKPENQNGAAVIFMVSGAFKSGIEMIDSGFYGPVGFKPFLERGYTVFLVSHGRNRNSSLTRSSPTSTEPSVSSARMPATTESIQSASASWESVRAATSR
jgi:hypothetical protein